MEHRNQSCLVVFSGGQDSTICLHYAIRNYRNVKAVFFDYGQRHIIEKQAACKIAEMNDIHLKIITLDFFKEMNSGALLDKTAEISHESGSLPNTFVPGRNLIFLTCAASYAYGLGISDIITGVCQTDYSGYPDCRENTIKSLEKSISLGLDKDVTIHTPLMYLTKAQSVDLAVELGAMESLAFSHTCYEGLYPPCGRCPACKLRARGFQEAGIEDPLFQRSYRQINLAAASKRGKG